MVRLIVLGNDKKVSEASASRGSYSKVRDSLYLIDPLSVKIRIKNGRPQGTEIIYFQGTPTPIGTPDQSKTLLREVVIINALKQTAETPMDLGILSFIGDLLSDPVKLIYYGLALAVIISVLSPLLQGGRIV